MSGAAVIVLARGGSKGVPGKNVAMIAGKPCIAWTLEHARAAKAASLVAVSSDDARAIGIARDAGCEVIERPAHLASDTARIDDAARHACEQLRERGKVTREQLIVILYANVPVRPAGLIDRAVQLLRESGCDSVQSYQVVGKHHPWWTARLGDEGQVRAWEGDVLNHGIFRRQDLPAAFVPDGAIIALTQRALFCEIAGATAGPHQFFGVDRRGVVNAEGSVVDIDSKYDLLLADAMLREQAADERVT
jgi:CMP-N,N'-diacetyllegionaminic acid synthase